ncbi:MAG: SH3 domain-containing protein [Lachnospiraceae bacterium]|jgi:SH3 domain protein|nr:SH3 domain-containing protein [Lachnospiraceae bacterium]
MRNMKIIVFGVAGLAIICFIAYNHVAGITGRHPTETTISIDGTTYTLSELSETMYADHFCRIRKGPAIDYEVIGTLNERQEVTVTGKVTETNWYQILINTEKGYVRGDLLRFD